MRLSICSGPGTYYKEGTTCTACPDGYYRTGDASPENNKCRPIPAGYRERITAAGGGDPSGTDAIAAKSEIVPCSKGTYSAWSGDASDPENPATRTPNASPTTCQACTGRMFAPRVGMQQCLACKAGTVPTKSVGSLLGPDQCSSCLDGTHAVGGSHNIGAWGYRDIFTNSDQCSTCPGGRETGPSGHTACTQW